MRKFAFLMIFLLLSATANLGQGIKWETDHKLALKKAKETGKPMLFDFWASWCKPCIAMDKAFWPKPEIVELSKQFICVKVDYDRDRDLAGKYFVTAIPNVVFTDPWGRGMNFQRGFGSGTEAQILEKIRILPKDFSSLTAAASSLDADEKNLDALSSFSLFYQERKLFWIALDYQKKIIKIEKDPTKLENAYLNLSFNLIRLGEADDAIDKFEELQKRFPASPQNDLYLYGLIVANVRKSKREKAVKYFAELESKFPTSKYIAEARKMI